MKPSRTAAHILGILGILGATPALAGYVEPQIAPRGVSLPHKAVYHFNAGDGPRLFNLLGNILNHLKAANGQADIRLVIHNDGVRQLQEPPAETRKRLDELRERQIAISVCNTSLKGRDLDWHSLHGVRETDLVASGVAEIVDLQMQGYAYIKP